MKDFIEQIKTLINIVEEIASEVENNENYQLIPELMNLLETILPKLFTMNLELECFKNDEIIEILNDIVDAFENKDSVLMIDVLKFGLNANLNKFIYMLCIKEENIND